MPEKKVQNIEKPGQLYCSGLKMIDLVSTFYTYVGINTYVRRYGSEHCNRKY